MPRSAGMHKSGVWMVREKAMDGFFNKLLDPQGSLNSPGNQFRAWEPTRNTSRSR
jgi:hypothetical protein